MKCNHFLEKIIRNYITWILIQFYFHSNQFKEKFEDLNHFKGGFKFSDLDPLLELYPKDLKKVIGKMRLETAPEIHLDEAL